ncbi:acyl-coenzyme A oxidase 3, peroxisomal [Selaginella moellendorffii]|uniref:acyl-coenzyme A oxidase 3, peroxisomal n=1 Tax=Selaginella moellendorffii TaxID=88036 RepID=UPI000D1C9C37|nr:acyl-coenzyme A oxidase 3, peroxisomal [Selaginella moellendorffii]|eukprot:XP_024523434.1 acyl-coenzyme A oxidase 3, peroxisomal [Selaginella moellendorffii]
MEAGQVSSAATRRALVLTGHLKEIDKGSSLVVRQPCLEYSPPELNSGEPAFDIELMQGLLDGHDAQTRTFIFNLMSESDLFVSRRVGRRVFLGADYNQPMEVQRELTMKRIQYFLDRGVFRGWLTDDRPQSALRMAAMFEYIGLFDHSLAIKLGVHFHLWGGSVKYLGSKRHHDKWLMPTEEFSVIGCFAMTELGHGSNVRGIETITVYDPSTQEFVINTPCESAQKYWIGGAAMHATHTVVFSQLHMNGKNEGVHAFIAEIRSPDGRICPGVRIADCGHKIGLNGVDNGRIWFDNKRVPRENLLNSVADVTPDGRYVSNITDADQRFGAFMAPLTSGRVTIAVSAVYQSKVGLATALRYALSRRAFSLSPNEPEVLLLDYPSHQHRLIPLLAKSYAMSFAACDLKRIYYNRKPEHAKIIHVLSSGYKAMFSWHNLKTLQECREACGGQGLKSENKVGQLKAEYDVQLTFEGDNNVLMQQVSKALLGDFFTSQKKQQPMKGLGLEHMNEPPPTIGTNANVRDVKFQLALFRLRERDLLVKLAQQVRELVSKGSTMANATLASYQLAEDLGRAFSERSVLESILSVENSLAPSPEKTILGLLRSLFVATTVDEDPVFLRHSYLSPDQALSIQKEVASLCREIRPFILSLVDAFGIPAPFLGPIAFDWIAANSWDLEEARS